MRTISSCSSCSGLPSRMHLAARGCSMNGRVVEGADGLGVGDAGRDHLAPARPAGHEVRLDQAGGDPQLRLHQAAVEPDDGAARRACGPRSDMVARRRVASWFTTRTVSSTHGSPTSSASSSPSFGAVQAGGDQHRDARSRGMPASSRVRIIGRRKSPFGTGPRDVADQDAGGALAARQLGERRRADGLGERAARPRRRGPAAPASRASRSRWARSRAAGSPAACRGRRGGESPMGPSMPRSAGRRGRAGGRLSASRPGAAGPSRPCTPRTTRCTSLWSGMPWARRCSSSSASESPG